MDRRAGARHRLECPQIAHPSVRRHRQDHHPGGLRQCPFRREDALPLLQQVSGDEGQEPLPAQRHLQDRPRPGLCGLRHPVPAQAGRQPAHHRGRSGAGHPGLGAGPGCRQHPEYVHGQRRHGLGRPPLHPLRGSRPDAAAGAARHPRWWAWPSASGNA